MEKALSSQWNIPTWFTSPIEKAWFYERLFFLVVIATVKDKKKYRIKDTMSIKTNFVH